MAHEALFQAHQPGSVISLEQIGSGPILGIIDQLYIKERFIGGFGTSEVRGPLGVRSLRASETQALSESKLFTTFPKLVLKKRKLVSMQLLVRLN